ncbi:MAG: hypothetical protein ABFR97_06685 [Thermodesulfobacteriota bacterium]
MNDLARQLVVAPLILGVVFAVVPPVAADELDQLYGPPALPSHVKYYEVDPADKVMLNPYLQVATPSHRAVLDRTKGVYNWVIDLEGDVRIAEPVAHPRGRRYQTPFTRPEDGYQSAAGYVERYGHISAIAGQPARIAGEIVNDRATGRWLINNKSGRYSRHVADRTPAQLLNAAALIRARVEPGGQVWGPVIYLLDYGPAEIKEQALGSMEVHFAEPEKKKMPYLIY